MYKSLHDFNASDITQLSIKEGQTFEYEDVCNEHWWTMRCNETGKVGLVPVSYLTQVMQVINMVSFHL